MGLQVKLVKSESIFNIPLQTLPNITCSKGIEYERILHQDGETDIGKTLDIKHITNYSI